MLVPARNRVKSTAMRYTPLSTEDPHAERIDLGFVSKACPDRPICVANSKAGSSLRDFAHGFGPASNIPPIRLNRAELLGAALLRKQAGKARNPSYSSAQRLLKPIAPRSTVQLYPSMSAPWLKGRGSHNPSDETFARRKRASRAASTRVRIRGKSTPSKLLSRFTIRPPTITAETFPT